VARFDEIELTPASFQPATAQPAAELLHAPRFRRLLALLTDLSLFVALALALSPLLPASMNWRAVAALAGFIVILSYYYFAGTWWLWGKTIGGAIFDVKIMSSGSGSMALRSASLRWVGLCLSLLTFGIGFLLAALPSRRSLADRLSGTCSVSAL
jgi:uncharacterized RDD family membrane protein YckC